MHIATGKKAKIYDFTNKINTDLVIFVQVRIYIRAGPKLFLQKTLVLVPDITY